MATQWVFNNKKGVLQRAVGQTASEVIGIGTIGALCGALIHWLWANAQLAECAATLVGR